MSQNISGSSFASFSSQSISRSKPKLASQWQQNQGQPASVSNKSQELYFEKRSAFKDRDAIQKQIDNRIENQEWVKNLSYNKEIYVIFGNYFNKNMAMLSKDIVAKHAETVDRF